MRCRYRIMHAALACALFCFTHITGVTAADTQPLSVAGIFGDHMVLQQQTANTLWGKSAASETVTIDVSWSQDDVTTVADAAGNWRASVQTPSAGGPFQLSIASAGERIEWNDIYVGEVWVCSGQSNMQWRMRGFGVDHFAEDVAKADHPRLRFCEIPAKIALEGQDDVQTTWNVCTPESVLNFSAVGYFFGSRLYEELDVPIGLVSCNWGGSSAEAWVSPEVLRKQFPEFNEVLDGLPAIAEQSGTTFNRGQAKPKALNQRTPSVLYNGMVRPLIPFAFRGVVWYQGESNVKNPVQYRTLFPAMIEDWRQRWGRGDYPFYFVQIAPFAYKTNPMSTAFLREAQTMALSVPKTGMVVTMDIGDFTNIHPKEKKPVGERLAKLALARDYGMSDIVDSGPLYKSHSIDGRSVRVEFTGTGSGLTTRDGKELTHFTIAGEDQNFVEANAGIDGDTVVVSSEKVSDPVSVRYAWGSGDMPNLSNKEGLPASSFRTDDWPVK
ncbi:MAG: sialate O-acetylesterase [Rhodopirellula sp. JB044]|uniref:sialate O-acetylesterase n=1 Tax=Rhodopirellula sp. JB044 TaxID=3342844 RepID=UPI00370AD435